MRDDLHLAKFKIYGILKRVEDRSSLFVYRVPVQRLLVFLAIALLALALCLLSPQTSAYTEAGIILNLPSQLGIYWGEDQPISIGEKTILPPDTEFAKKIYRSPHGDQINCEIVLSGAEKRSIHRPEICLPGQGWTIQASEVIPVPLKNGTTLSVMRLTLTKSLEINSGTQKTVTIYFLYWFVGKDKTTPNHWERILLSSWDRIAHNVNHRWAYVTVSTAVTENLDPHGLNPEQTMQLLKDFIGELAPVITKKEVVIR